MNDNITPKPPVIDQTPSLKGFPLADLLSLSSGLLLPQSSPVRLHMLVAYLTGADPSAAASRAKDAKACLEEQLGFLKTVDFSPLHGTIKNGVQSTLKNGGMDARLEMWFGQQVKKFGDEHYVMPLARWERRRNSHKL